MGKTRLLDFLAGKSHLGFASNAERIVSKWLDHAAIRNEMGEEMLEIRAYSIRS